MEDLKKNLESWESYEKQRNTLDGHIDGAQKEFEDTCRVYNLETGPKDYVTRVATAGEDSKKEMSLLYVPENPYFLLSPFCI